MAHVFAAKFLASGGPRRLLPEEVCAQQLCYYFFQYASRGRDFAVLIVTLAEQLFHHGVDHHIAGAGVESYDLAQGRAGGNRRQVRNAANVLGNTSYSGVAIHQVIEKRNEWSALAAGRDIRGAKIRDHRYT